MERWKLLAKLEAEAFGGGFIWDKQAATPYEPPPPRKRRAQSRVSKDPEYRRRKRIEQREKWIAMGIVKP